ncbi:MAG: DUF5678 domain-containing protein [Candidatus Magasanikbacteria bacterium]|nr:DUF5678 domain-containing protein [Candidatus Magasanikbacteria bacterium]
MSALNWAKLYEKYKGLWVALEKDEETVIAAGVTAKETLQKAEQQGKPNPILARMPDQLVTYVGSS